MKKMLLMVAFAAAITTNVNANTVANNDTIVKADTVYQTNDDDILSQWEAVGAEFDRHADKYAEVYENTEAHAGNSPVPVTMKRQRMKGLDLYGKAGGNLTGEDFSPEIGGGVRYQATKWMVYSELSYFSSKPFKTSDDQRRTTGLLWNTGAGWNVLKGTSNHALYTVAEVEFRTVKDVKVFDEFETVSVVETETEITTTYREGDAFHRVKNYNIGGNIGLMYVYNVPRSVLSFHACVKGGIRTQLGDNAIRRNASASITVGMGIQLFRGKKASKAADMVRF